MYGEKISACRVLMGCQKEGDLGVTGVKGKAGRAWT
jgi:hypothetical protein